MELQQIQTTTTWNEAAGRINSNNAKIETELYKLANSTYKNKGYFKTIEGLRAAYPTASIGSKAYVGTSYPFAVFWWNGTAWINEGETGGDENLNLSEYYTKEEVQEAIRNSYIVLSQKAYDALEVKEEDKLYFTYEED